MALLAALPAGAADAAPAYLVKELNTAPVQDSDSQPGEFVTLAGMAYFTADDGWHGTELWRSDGTADGTTLLADINPGERSSVPRDLTVIGDAVWFTAWDGRRGCGVWRTDGTPAGTAPVAIVHTTLARCTTTFGFDRWPAAFTAAGDAVYFVAYTEETGQELWRSDGTAAGTHLVADVFPGFEDARPRALTALGDVLYFFADDGVSGVELWRSDGSAAGTVRVRDIAPGSADGIPVAGLRAPQPVHMAALGGAVLFAANDGVHGVELWRSDGTEAGTTLVADTSPQTAAIGGLSLGEAATPFVPVGAALRFFSLRADPPRLVVWRTDGTEAGTAPLGEIAPAGPGSLLANPLALGEAMYFSLQNGIDRTALWRADAGGVTLVTTLSGVRLGAFTAFRASFVFLAPDASGDCALWRSDGTADGTRPVRGVAGLDTECPGVPVQVPAPAQLGRLGDRLLLPAADPARGRELFVSDGTPDGTHLLADLNDTRNRSQGTRITLHPGATLDALVFFNAAPEDRGPRLWRSDGTADGTFELAPVTLHDAAAIGERLVFTAFDYFNGGALWSSDGTAAGMQLVRILPLGIPWHAMATAAGLFLTSADAETGEELWRSDGTAAGTFRVRDLTPGPPGTDFGPRAAFAGGLAFVVQRPAGDELWTSDGTEAGTLRISAMSGARNRIRELVDVDGTLYLDVVGSPVTSSELWRSDGTAAGTRRVLDLGALPGPAGIAWLAAGPGLVLFAAYDEASGVELWRSDGTAAGSRRVRDVFPGPGSALVDPDGALVPRTARAGATMLFIADDGVHGLEPWRSNGQAIGTALVRDIDPRARPLLEDFALTLQPVGAQVLLAPHDAEAGTEPWISNGTAAGTRRLADIAPGPRSGLRAGAPFAVTRTHAFLVADDGRTGDELWAIPRAALGLEPSCAGDCDGDAVVTIAELVRGVGIALGTSATSTCAALDADGNGAATIAELVAAVAAALNGC